MYNYCLKKCVCVCGRGGKGLNPKPPPVYTLDTISSGAYYGTCVMVHAKGLVFYCYGSNIIREIREST